MVACLRASVHLFFEHVPAQGRTKNCMPKLQMARDTGVVTDRALNDEADQAGGAAAKCSMNESEYVNWSEHWEKAAVDHTIGWRQVLRSAEIIRGFTSQ